MTQNVQRSAHRHTRRWLPYAGAVVLAALIIAGLWPQPLPVETARATTGSLRATVNEEGKTRIKQRYVVSAPVTGQLRRVPFKAGAEVRAGETVVAVIEPVSPTLLDARTIGVQPYEKKMIQVIEKAIREADLGLNPSVNSDIIRVPMPMMSEERRKELVKLVKGEAEDARVAIRSVRRDANNALKDALKAKTISEDEERRAQDDVQKLTDKTIAEVDKQFTAKEAELMSV